MSDENLQAAEFRQQAKRCFEVAERLSVREDRKRMMEMARRFLELAREVDDRRGELSGS